MEKVCFMYSFKDEGHSERKVNMFQGEEDGIYCDDVCELFLDFMKSVGYSEDNVREFFKD